MPSMLARARQLRASASKMRGTSCSSKPVTTFMHPDAVVIPGPHSTQSYFSAISQMTERAAAPKAPRESEGMPITGTEGNDMRIRFAQASGAATVT